MSEKMDMIEFDVEYTDTFSGQANYAWVTRKTLELPDNVPDRTLVRAAKAALGMTGVRCKREDMGDAIALRPVGANTIIFITPNI